MDVSETVNRVTATEKSDRLQRCLAWVQDCKRAVNELRSEVKAAISNREKCCMVLSAAMAASLALESLVYSGKVDRTKEQQLQRLCAKVTSTVDLAGARVKVYGQQTRLQKYCKFFRKQHTIDKFDAVINQLDEHTEKAWQLTDNSISVRRRGMRASFSQGLQTLSVSTAADSNVFDSAERADAQPFHSTPLTRCRLRRGNRHNGVRCMVFINPETSMHAGTMGHVWWYIAGAVGGNLYKHDLACDSVVELEDARKEPPVSAMHHDAQGHVWVGHKGGMVRVWSERDLTPVTLPIKCFHAEIRVIVTDGTAAWVGSDSGNVKRIELQTKQVTGGNTRCWLEHTHTLRHVAKSRRSSNVFGSTASADLDDLSRADSARASEMSVSEEPAAGPVAARAHAGPVTAVEVHSCFVFTSGGAQSHPALHQWSASGMLQHSHKLNQIGVARAIKVLSSFVHVRAPINITQQRSSETGLENMDTSSLSSVGTQSPGTDNIEAVPAQRHSNWQILTAHDNGQMQVWDMSSGMLCPVLRFGAVGPAARCLVVCQSLGLFATAHADGKLYLRLLPNLKAGEGPTVGAGEPLQTLSKDPTAMIQAHRSGMVSAIEASSGIITCGIFGSIMWWPEAELRSCVEAAGMRLSSQERIRSLKSGRESPGAAMSKVLRRYFTPSSAALAQATLERMHSSGDLQGSLVSADVMSSQPQELEESDARVQPAAGGEQQPPPPDHVTSPTGEHTLKTLSSSGPAAQQFISEVSRILEEGNALQESDQEMTDRIAHAVSMSNVASHDGTGSARSSQESARSSGFAGPASGPLEVPPSLPGLSHQYSGGQSGHASATQAQPPPVHSSHAPLTHRPLLAFATGSAQQQQQDQRLVFTAARLNEHDAQFNDTQEQNAVHRDDFVQQQPQRHVAPLRKSVSLDRDSPAQTNAVTSSQPLQRASCSSSSRRGSSLSDAEAAAFQRPAAVSVDTSAFGRTSGSSLSSSIFGESSQWVIEYSDLTFRKVIGEGSIGRVHLGRWQETDVAIKVLGHVPPQTTMPTPAPMQSTGHMSAIAEADSEEPDVEGLADSSMAATIRTLEREVSILSAIRHPNVVLFMGVCLDPPCMVTEFCARGSLFDVLAKASTSPLLAQQLDWPKRVSMALDAAKGMLQLHSHKPPILHRDLKSPNLLVDKHWRVKIADFNLSRVMEAQSIVSSLSTNNPRWLAPEVVTDQAYSTAADVYSFGLILWELLTWQLPWADLGPFQIMVAIAEKKRRPTIPPESEVPGGTFSGLPAYLDLMQACWHADPQERPAFESCIITLRSLLEEAMTVKSQQKAADRDSSSSPRQPAGPSPFTTSSQGTAPAERAPPSQPAPSHPGRDRASDGLAQQSQSAATPATPATPGPSQLTGSLPSAPISMQQLQHNLLKPATHSTARVSPPGPPDAQPELGRGQPEASASQRRDSSAGTGSVEHGGRPQPAHVRSRNALMALQSQSPGAMGSAQQFPRMPVHQQMLAAQQALVDPPDSTSKQQQQPVAEGRGMGHQQAAPAAAPDRRSLQRPGQDVFKGDLTDGDRQDRQQSHQIPARQALLWQQQDGHHNGSEAGEADDSSGGQAGVTQQMSARQSKHQLPHNPRSALPGAGGGNSHMSPFAGFAALTKARSSMDHQPDNNRMGAGVESRGPSLDQIVDRRKVLKGMPTHMRRSLDTALGPYKSLHRQAPPPASSSGMRNSLDGINPESADQASARWDEERRRKSLEATDDQPPQQSLQGLSEVGSTITEVPSHMSGTDAPPPEAALPSDSHTGSPDVTSTAQHTDTGSSGLSKFSPFASTGLVNMPSF